MATPFLSPDPSDTGSDLSRPSPYPSVSRRSAPHAIARWRVTGTHGRDRPRGLPRSSARLAQPLRRRKHLATLFGRRHDRHASRTVDRRSAQQDVKAPANTAAGAEKRALAQMGPVLRPTVPDERRLPCLGRHGCGRTSLDEGRPRRIDGSVKKTCRPGLARDRRGATTFTAGSSAWAIPWAPRCRGGAARRRSSETNWGPKTRKPPSSPDSGFSRYPL